MVRSGAPDGAVGRTWGGESVGPSPGDERALYGISVAAELTGVNPPVLRSYEARGLLRPRRTEGGTRRYSGQDLTRIRRITTLLAAGLNLTGVEHVLALEAETERLHREVDQLNARLARPRAQPRAERG